MTQSRQNYTLGLGTRGATPDLPLAHPRPTKPLPTARSNASSRSSDKVANAVYNNGQSTHSSYSMPVAAKSTHHLSSRPESRPSASSAAIGGRSHDRHYGSADFEKGLQGLDQSRLLSTEYPSVARAASPMQSLHHFQTGGHSANVDHLISTYAHEGYESDSVEDKAMQILVS